MMTEFKKNCLTEHKKQLKNMAIKNNNSPVARLHFGTSALINNTNQQPLQILSTSQTKIISALLFV